MGKKLSYANHWPTTSAVPRSAHPRRALGHACGGPRSARPTRYGHCFAHCQFLPKHPLRRLFQEAHCAQAILLFDEADSLFANRTQVSSANDRYANLEVNYLLQLMENYDGISILTTNMESSIDAAFKRHIKFHLRFPLPGAPERVRLWKSFIPMETPRQGMFDFEALARHFEMSGGNIKNAVVRAAFLAAGDSRALTQEHLVRAAIIEYSDLGNAIRENDISGTREFVKK
ncbi:MAG: ATP-binding protein [Myxococcales bacterium]|nr:ATP-binding protein [Myxococcales bacterium]